MRKHDPCARTSGGGQGSNAACRGRSYRRSWCLRSLTTGRRRAPAGPSKAGTDAHRPRSVRCRPAPGSFPDRRRRRRGRPADGEPGRHHDQGVPVRPRPPADAAAPGRARAAGGRAFAAQLAGALRAAELGLAHRRDAAAARTGPRTIPLYGEPVGLAEDQRPGGVGPHHREARRSWSGTSTPGSTTTTWTSRRTRGGTRPSATARRARTTTTTATSTTATASTRSTATATRWTTTATGRTRAARSAPSATTAWA